MPSRIRLYNRSGTLIYEPSAPSFREWVVNDIGSASFTLKAAGMEPYIEFGNYITIEHDKLDTWVGVLTTPRNWNPKTVTLTAKSAMWLFAQRAGSYAQDVSGSWGEVFSQLIGIVNAAEPTLLQIGTFDGGITYSSTVDLSNVYTYLQRALAQAQTRIDFRPVMTAGKLAIFADMKPALYTASNLKLEEGFNLKNNSSILIEQGEIHNDVTILGVSLDQTKLSANGIDAASVAKYGKRQIVFSEGQSQTDVDRLADVRVTQYAYPRRTLALTVLDKGDTFLYTRAGNSADVRLRSVGYLNGGLGFQGTAYIRTLQYSDTSGEAALVCEEL